VLIGFSPPSSVSEPVSIESLTTVEGEDERQLREAKATLQAGHIVELVEVVTVSSTSIKLVWEVSPKPGGSEKSALRPSLTYNL